jgi:hypothetical protein
LKESRFPSFACGENRLRSERALLLAIAEMYVQGVSTRRVKRIVEELCGLEVSSSQVSPSRGEHGLRGTGVITRASAPSPWRNSRTIIHSLK